MKFAVREGTNPANVSSILRYLGLKKYDFIIFSMNFSMLGLPLSELPSF